MVMWTVYENPSDYPGKFVARKFVIGRGTFEPSLNDVHVADTLEAVRGMIPVGLVCTRRQPDDDPCIVEVWL